MASLCALVWCYLSLCGGPFCGSGWPHKPISSAEGCSMRAWKPECSTTCAKVGLFACSGWVMQHRAPRLRRLRSSLSLRKADLSVSRRYKQYAETTLQTTDTMCRIWLSIKSTLKRRGGDNPLPKHSVSWQHGQQIFRRCF